MRPAMAFLRGGRGNSGVVVAAPADTFTDTEVHPVSASAYVDLSSLGAISTHNGAYGLWLSGSTTGSDYECRATIVSGTLSSGTTGSWLALSSDRRWTVTRVAPGDKTCILTIEIGLVGTSTTLSTGEVTLTAEVVA